MARQIQNEAQARVFVAEMAKTHTGAHRRDMDALLSLGDADLDTILQGYLWAEIEKEMGEMDEDTEELLVDAISDMYIDLVEG